MKTNYDAMMQHLTDHTEPLSRLQNFEYAQCTEGHCRNGVTKFSLSGIYYIRSFERESKLGFHNQSFNRIFGRIKRQTERTNERKSGRTEDERTNGRWNFEEWKSVEMTECKKKCKHSVRLPEMAYGGKWLSRKKEKGRREVA